MFRGLGCSGPRLRWVEGFGGSGGLGSGGFPKSEVLFLGVPY